MSKALELALCDTQGKLFELSARRGYNSEAFVKAYMNSSVAADMDLEFHHVQWAGKEYVLSRLEEECSDSITPSSLCQCSLSQSSLNTCDIGLQPLPLSLTECSLYHVSIQLSADHTASTWSITTVVWLTFTSSLNLLQCTKSAQASSLFEACPQLLLSWNLST